MDIIKQHTSSQYRVKLIRVLALLMLFMLCIYFSASAQGSQSDIFSDKVILPAQRTTVYKALNQLTDSIGYLFAYDSRLVDSDKKIRLQAQTVSLKQALYQILGDTSYVFKVFDNHILIHAKKRADQAELKQKTDDQMVSVLSGRVLDSQTRNPIPYVTVGISQLALGTITNQEGFFQLKIPTDSVVSISLMHLGYKSREVPVSLLAAESVDIFLEMESISIQEVIIRNIDPKQLVREAFAQIPSNYSTEPVYFTAFYREGVVKNGKYQNYSEAIFKIFKSSYTKQFQTDQVKMLKSRKTQNLEPADTVSIKLKGGVNSSLSLDLARHKPYYFEDDFLEYYNFLRKDIVTLGSRMAYAIAFNLKENINEPLLEGVLYIDIENLAILGADFQINPQNIDRITDEYVYKSNRRFRFRPLSIAYSVRYNNYNGRYYLSHVRGDLHFKYRYRRRLFSNSFHLFFELATNQVDTTNVTRFTRRELEPTQNVFLDNSWTYDQAFWGDQNIIRPEKNIFDALQDINAKIEEIQFQ